MEAFGKVYLPEKCALSNTPTLCVILRLGLFQREHIVYLEVSNELTCLKFKLPLCKMFLKSSTEGVWNSNGVANFVYEVINVGDNMHFMLVSE